jgi:hypothetical protein
VSLTLEEGLIAFLSADVNLRIAIGDSSGGLKLFPGVAPQGTPYPYATYQIPHQDEDQGLAATSHQPIARIQLDAYGEAQGGYGSARGLANLLKWSQGGNLSGPRLEMFTGSLGGVLVQGCRIAAGSFGERTETPESGSEFPVRRFGFDLIVTYSEQLSVS